MPVVTEDQRGRLRFRLGNVGALGVLLCLVAGLVGCQPPFDASGTFHGEWAGQLYTAIGDPEVTVCPFTLILKQNRSGIYPFNSLVWGTLSLNFTCFIQGDLGQWVNYNSFEFPIYGHMESDGALKLYTGVCPGEQTLCLDAALLGKGQDANGEQLMDLFSGDGHFYFSKADIEPVDLQMQFYVTTDRRGYKPPEDWPPGDIWKPPEEIPAKGRGSE